MAAYYNENDRVAAHVLECLIKDRVIAPGVVDSRSIADVQPGDLHGFAQVHLFAGGGIWSLAARMAGWPDDRPLFSGSAPCQPFSVAGKQLGEDDPRHLWPHMFRLIRAVRPPVVVGEQVSGTAGYNWFDGVSLDLENEGYASRALDLPACACDGPHIRQRLYWSAVKTVDDPQRVGWGPGREDHASHDRYLSSARSEYLHLGDAQRAGLEGHARHGDDRREPGRLDQDAAGSAAAAGSCNGSVADADLWRQQIGGITQSGGIEGSRRHVVDGRSAVRELDHAAAGSCNGSVADADRGGCGGWQEAQERAPERGTAPEWAGRNGSFWSDYEWREGADGKARRVKPGLRLLAHGVHGRVGLLRIGGNAVVAPLAAEVLAALMETI